MSMEFQVRLVLCGCACWFHVIVGLSFRLPRPRLYHPKVLQCMQACVPARHMHDLPERRRTQAIEFDLAAKDRGDFECLRFRVPRSRYNFNSSPTRHVQSPDKQSCISVHSHVFSRSTYTKINNPHHRTPLNTRMAGRTQVHHRRPAYEHKRRLHQPSRLRLLPPTNARRVQHRLAGSADANATSAALRAAREALLRRIAQPVAFASVEVASRRLA